MYVSWKDKFGDNNMFVEGRGDDVFYKVKNNNDKDGDPIVDILSKAAMVEFLKKCGYNIYK